MHLIPGLELRTDEDSEILGIDDAEMGEFAYDYVGLEAEINPKQDYSQEMPGSELLHKGSAATSVQEKERQSV